MRRSDSEPRDLVRPEKPRGITAGSSPRRDRHDRPLSRPWPAGGAGFPASQLSGPFQTVVQVLPPSVKAVGAVLVVLLVPVKPSTMELFAEITAVYPAGATLTFEPL